MSDEAQPRTGAVPPEQAVSPTPSASAARPEPPPATGVPGAPIAVHAVSAQRTETLLISPYISPTDLEAYHALNPRLAARLVAHNLASINRAAEEEARENEHRRALERADQAAEIADRREARALESRGQRWAGVIALAGFVLCGFAVYSQQPTAAIWLGCTMIVSLVSAFILGRVLGKSPSPGDPPSGSTPPQPAPQLPDAKDG